MALAIAAGSPGDTRIACFPFPTISGIPPTAVLAPRERPRPLPPEAHWANLHSKTKWPLHLLFRDQGLTSFTCPGSLTASWRPVDRTASSIPVRSGPSPRITSCTRSSGFRFKRHARAATRSTWAFSFDRRPMARTIRSVGLMSRRALIAWRRMASVLRPGVGKSTALCKTATFLRRNPCAASCAAKASLTAVICLGKRSDHRSRP